MKGKKSAERSFIRVFSNIECFKRKGAENPGVPTLFYYENISKHQFQ